MCKKNRHDIVCVDCGNDEVIGYMVHPDLWNQYVERYLDTVCPFCFERRMGRRITQEDLTDVPINRGVMQFLDAFHSGTVTYEHYRIWYTLAFMVK